MEFVLNFVVLFVFIVFVIIYVIGNVIYVIGNVIGFVSIIDVWNSVLKYVIVLNVMKDVLWS